MVTILAKSSLQVLHTHIRQKGFLFAGGFAKVKLAYHALTGDKVAIKIMDKKTLGVCNIFYVYVSEYNGHFSFHITGYVCKAISTRHGSNSRFFCFVLI